ncbi:hypothetical protein JDV02_003390 [Purpureocillium takamizusanense]|uniref:Uncharacterized protein n=1 Tax=Purpureocillium takamizusanense TaxID=2060973 RepID=A0A9Q8QCB4_9HYPO|nr:uncharacterized protein JDV02_003390 [Purpureocillium takamizusanense]UNI17010.1 hypothetical protein JDV02_003390 [Purpureocillium takamizusanense]
MRLLPNIIILAVATAAMADYQTMKLPVYPLTKMGSRDDTDSNISHRRDTCVTPKIDCNGGCMPAHATCCPTKGFCNSGEVCDGDGCCPIFKKCSGVVGGCASNQEKCKDGCMAKGGDCCSDGKFCDPGYTCSSGGKCRGSGKSDGASMGFGNLAAIALGALPVAAMGLA